MSKRLILVLALAFVVGLAFSAYAEVQNVKVSGDISMSSVYRQNIMLQETDLAYPKNTAYAGFGSTINAFLTTARLRVDADLTDNVAVAVRLLNERAWDTETATSTDIDLDLAYVTLKEFLNNTHHTLILGRQLLRFGNGLVIGDPDTNGIAAGHATAAIDPRALDDLSARKSFDALRATLNYDPMIVDLVYSKIAENNVDVNDDADLYGVNANFGIDKNTFVEGYYWEKRREKVSGTQAALGAPATGEPRTNHADIVRTLGGRVQFTGIEKLWMSLEGAYQFGRYVRNTALYPNGVSNDGIARTRNAFAIQMISNLDLSGIEKIGKYVPALGLSYTMLSGDSYKSTDKTYRGWDSMFEDQAGGTLFNKILGYSNAHLLGISASMKPTQDIKLGLDFYKLWLFRAFNSTGNDPQAVVLSGVAGDPSYYLKTDEKDIGSELDASVTYDYTEDVQFGLMTGLFMPGDLFQDYNDENALQVIGSMKVTF